MAEEIKVPRKKNPLPEPVLEIMRDVARYQYRKLVEAGWCITCYRKPAGETTRCEDCRARHDELQEVRNRAAGNKPWRGWRPRQETATPHSTHQISSRYRSGAANPMNVELSSIALKLVNDVFRTGLFGGTAEETARRLIEERLHQLIADGMIKPSKP